MSFPKQAKGPISQEVSRAARAAGLSARKANQAIAYEPDSGRFWFAPDVEESARWTRRSMIEWLLEFIQCDARELPLKGEYRPQSIEAFIVESAFYAKDKAPKPSRPEVVRFRSEIAHAVKSFLLNPKPLSGWAVVPDRRFSRRLVWVGNPPKATPSLDFVGGDWRTRFKLRAQELLAEFALEIRQCERCKRLFLIHDRRQKFCANACRNRALLERYRSGLSESQWKEKRRAYYQASKLRSGAGTVTRRGRR
jgi:hypothetical protein